MRNITHIFALLFTLGCSIKDTGSEATTDANASTTGTATTTGTTEATVTDGGSTELTTLVPTTTNDPDNCVDFCGEIEFECNAPVDTDTSGPDCPDGFHCANIRVPTNVCACEAYLCEVDCDPDDPNDCSEMYQECDPQTGACFYNQCETEKDCCGDFENCLYTCSNGLCREAV